MRAVGPPIFLGAPGATPLTVAFWLTFYLWLFSELFLGWKKRAPATASVQDRGSRWIVIAGVWLSVTLGIGVAVVVPALTIRAGRAALLFVGIALMLAGMALRWYAVRVLGRSFTLVVATQPGQQVMERGPYRFVRHPSYSGSLITIVGVLVACANPLSLLGLVPALIGYMYRIRVEEETLSENLGEAYRSYMRRTRRLIPFLL
jgi:protein-S-isoprenylcysteine O-methyltransferase Ste14